MKDKGFGITELIITVAILAIIVVGGLMVYIHEHNKATLVKGVHTQVQITPPAVSSDYAVLSPASVPSKTAECSLGITYASNGVPGPVQCPNGDLNSTEWNALAALEPSVFKLGYSVNIGQVQTALCSDVAANISNPIELTVYQIASLYYGWSFSSNPSAVLTNGSCNNVDD
jgi:prepilin-type N-terminal cleavage/methylation domain-containing protein